MYCPKCGTYNNEFVSYCYKCGYELKSANPSENGTNISQNGNGFDLRNTPNNNQYYSSNNRDSYIGDDFAGFWKRFAAYIIDSILLYGVSLILELFIFPIFGIKMSNLVTTNTSAYNNPYDPVSLPSGFWKTYLIIVIVTAIINWLYYALMESSSKQATIGKMAVGIKVTNYQGERIGFGRATGRFFAKYISGFTLCIGFLMAGFTNNKQALHDMIASTYVVNK